jgi:ankyrin repeat protein
MTPLMLAAEFNTNPRVLGLLLDAGADAEAKNRGGKKALDLAAGNENVRGSDAYLVLQRASH